MKKYDRDRSLEKNVEFMTDPTKTGVLVRCGIGSVPLPPMYSLEKYNFPDDIKLYCDHIVARSVEWEKAHSEVDDDWLPLLKPVLGHAIHSCFFGGGVVYAGGTSYPEHQLKDVTEWRTLKMDKNLPHYKILLDGMEYMYELCPKIGFYTTLRGCDGPMDLANVVRGNDLLYDFYDEPEATKEFMSFCADAVAWTFENQRQFASKVAGGYFSGWDTFMPGFSLGHIAEDATCFISPQTYEEFGIPYTNQLLEKYDYEYLHIHTISRAFIPYFLKLEKVGTFQIASDPNQPDSFEVYREYAHYFEGKVVHIDISAKKFLENLDFFNGKRTIVNVSTHGVEEAKRVVEAARSID